MLNKDTDLKYYVRSEWGGITTLAGLATEALTYGAFEVVPLKANEDRMEENRSERRMRALNDVLAILKLGHLTSCEFDHRGSLQSWTGALRQFGLRRWLHELYLPFARATSLGEATKRFILPNLSVAVNGIKKDTKVILPAAADRSMFPDELLGNPSVRPPSGIVAWDESNEHLRRLVWVEGRVVVDWQQTVCGLEHVDPVQILLGGREVVLCHPAFLTSKPWGKPIP